MREKDNGSTWGPPGSQVDPQDIEGRLQLVEGWVTYLEDGRRTTQDALSEALSHLDALSRLPDRLDHLTLAVAEGISHVDRAERRVRTVVQRAREKLAERGIESAGIEAEAAELRLINGDGGEQDQVQAVPTDVAQPQPTRHDQLRERLRQLKLSS